MFRHSGKAAGHSALVAQTCRLPRAPHADWTWHVCPPPSQQTVPVAQSVEAAQTIALPPGQAVPGTHALLPAASAALVQHTAPVAQSVGAPQTRALPEGHAVPVWHAFGAPAAPAQHT
jgi:hypothetical protein